MRMRSRCWSRCSPRRRAPDRRVGPARSGSPPTSGSWTSWTPWPTAPRRLRSSKSGLMGVQPADLLSGALDFLRDVMVSRSGRRRRCWPPAPARRPGSRPSPSDGRWTRSWPPSRSWPRPGAGSGAAPTAGPGRVRPDPRRPAGRPGRPGRGRRPPRRDRVGAPRRPARKKKLTPAEPEPPRVEPLPDRPRAPPTRPPRRPRPDAARRAAPAMDLGATWRPGQLGGSLPPELARSSATSGRSRAGAGRAGHRAGAGLQLGGRRVRAARARAKVEAGLGQLARPPGRVRFDRPAGPGPAGRHPRGDGPGRRPGRRALVQ